MKNNFKIDGLFYKNNNHLCRKYLDIKRSDLKDMQPDLMVVMMNPGSSKPEDRNDNNTSISKAVPDKTQNQIMKIMNDCNFSYARILNLSDIREPKSGIFYSKLNELDKNSHSIFSNERIEDFETLFVKEVPVIFAWGVNKNLISLAMMAVERINEKEPFGILKEGTTFAYYHPLPQNYHAQEKWCKDIIHQIQTRQR